jgi:3-oxo-5alpha-steroid 4-dehydrogenase
VVLCAGGFIYSKSMVMRHAPWLRQCRVRLGTPADDGTGIRLGAEVGGATSQMDAAMVALPFSPPRSLLQGVLVNGRGQRFVNEDVYQSLAGEHSLKRQGGEVYLIVDDATFVRPRVPTEIAAVGETFDELEKELGLTRGGLTATMASYNAHALEGRDPFFDKDPRWVTPLTRPPYAALDLRTKSQWYAAFTLGGLRTRPSGAVLNHRDEAISGLYAAGRNAASVPARGYSSGLSLADATFFGRLAGKAAAAHDSSDVGVIPA